MSSFISFKYRFTLNEIFIFIFRFRFRLLQICAYTKCLYSCVFDMPTQNNVLDFPILADRKGPEGLGLGLGSGLSAKMPPKRVYFSQNRR